MEICSLFNFPPSIHPPPLLLLSPLPPKLTIPFSKVTAITKERTAFVFPNAVQVTTTADKYTFSSLMSRDITYNVLFKVWQNSLLNEVTMMSLLVDCDTEKMKPLLMLRMLGLQCFVCVFVSRSKRSISSDEIL